MSTDSVCLFGDVKSTKSSSSSSSSSSREEPIPRLKGGKSAIKSLTSEINRIQLVGGSSGGGGSGDKQKGNFGYFHMIRLI